MKGRTYTVFSIHVHYTIYVYNGTLTIWITRIKYIYHVYFSGRRLEEDRLFGWLYDDTQYTHTRTYIQIFI